MRNENRDDAIRSFVGINTAFYQRAFLKIGMGGRLTVSWNTAAALLGPLWLGSRSLWGAFWPVFIVELYGLVVFARGMVGGASNEVVARTQRLSQMAASRLLEAQQAAASHSPFTQSLQMSAVSLARAAEQARANAAALQGREPLLIALGLAVIIVVRIWLGLFGSRLLAKRFQLWRRNSNLSRGLSLSGVVAAVGLEGLIVPVTLYAFTTRELPTFLVQVPAVAGWHENAALWLDKFIAALGYWVSPVSFGVTHVIATTLDFIETCLVQTPWPVVMVIILALAWQLAGRGVFLLTAFALAYLGTLGYWAKAMETVALLGTASFISVAIGIPLGLWCGYRLRIYKVVRPILDFMQTLPAFVYLIPVIAFFGIGKPSGIIATVIFGVPPIVRLTALGIQGVPENVREATRAFGATRAFVAWRVDLPLALPSIKIGINQTILMCLSMVVIAALIGAKGLGEDVLNSLQDAAEGEGILAGLAILACALVLDRIVQGKSAER